MTAIPPSAISSMRNSETNVDDILYAHTSVLFNRYPAPLSVNGVPDLTPLGVNGILQFLEFIYIRNCTLSRIKT
jgi:hypothetical protein